MDFLVAGAATGAASDGQELRRRRHAIADRGDQRDIGCIGIDQPCGRRPRAFVLRVGEGGIDCPGLTFAPNRGATGFVATPAPL